MDPAPPAPQLGTDTASARLRAALDAGEEVTHLVPAIGCVVALTTSRLLVVREGSAFRPKTGVREWEVGANLTVRAGTVRHGTGSMVIKWDREATSVFVRGDRWEEALALVGAVRARTRRDEEAARRSPVRTPDG